jgi:hypothetical protein
MDGQLREQVAEFRRGEAAERNRNVPDGNRLQCPQCDLQAESLVLSQAAY